MSSVETIDNWGSKRTMKSTKEELFRWICEKRATDSFVDRHMVREKALKLANIRGLNGFKCSNKWITSFLKEHGFSADLTNHSGPMFGNYRDWIDLMRSTIIKYKHNDLFHADELTMFSDIPPTRIASNKMDSAESACPPRNRITILMGCNSSGTTKLPLLICGPYSCRVTTKGHVYSHSESCYNSDDLFRNWLSRLDDRMSRCNRKILLFLRRNRAHALRDFPLSNVKLVYFPEGFPPLLRPLRRDVFHYVKMIFRRSYAERMSQYTTEWNLRDILKSVIDAWETIPREIIICSFQRTHFRTDDSFLQINCGCWANLNTGISFKRFVTFDDDLSDERASPVNSNRYHEYNLRQSCRDVAQVDKVRADPASENEEEVSEAKSQEPSLESDRDYRTMLLDLRNHIDQKLERALTTNRDTIRDDQNQDGRRNRLKREFVERSGDQSKSQKKSYSEIQFAAKGQSGDRRASRDRMIKNAFASKDPDVSPSRSIEWTPFKRETLQRRPTGQGGDVTQSLQAIIDKALTLTTSAKTDYARKLIDSIYASKQEANNGASYQAKSKNSNGGDNVESICPNEQVAGPKCESTTEQSLENISSMSLAAQLSLESCQPSTSTKDCDWNTLSKIKPNGFQTIDTGLPKEAPSNNGFESDVGNRTLSGQNPAPASFVHQDSLKFSKKTRRESSETNSSGNDSNGSEPSKKKLKMDYDWSKQFETTFVFGSSNTPDPGNCSSQHQRDENIIDSCIFHTTPSVSPKD